MRNLDFIINELEVVSFRDIEPHTISFDKCTILTDSLDERPVYENILFTIINALNNPSKLLELGSLEEDLMVNIIFTNYEIKYKLMFAIKNKSINFRIFKMILIDGYETYEFIDPNNKDNNDLLMDIDHGFGNIEIDVIKDKLEFLEDLIRLISNSLQYKGAFMNIIKTVFKTHNIDDIDIITNMLYITIRNSNNEIYNISFDSLPGYTKGVFELTFYMLKYKLQHNNVILLDINKLPESLTKPFLRIIQDDSNTNSHIMVLNRS